MFIKLGNRDDQRNSERASENSTGASRQRLPHRRLHQQETRRTVITPRGFNRLKKNVETQQAAVGLLDKRVMHVDRMRSTPRPQLHSNHTPNASMTIHRMQYATGINIAIVKIERLDIAFRK